MALTVEELEWGIERWKTFEGWDKDFGNRFCEVNLPKLRPLDGIFNDAWWDSFYQTLWDWRATRPKPREFLTARIRERYESLTTTWARSVVPYVDKDMLDVRWSDVREFPSLVSEIKDVSSIVFTAKFCHFLVPKLFPVMDNEAMGNPYSSYGTYFTLAQEEWKATNDKTKEELVTRLSSEIGAPVFQSFPMKCKLVELCFIGRHTKVLVKRAGIT